MSYFSDHYGAFSYPLEAGDNAGFRLAQLGAIHATGAHFVTRTDPGVVTMPTGSGKTAVLTACAFVLRAKRVLVITPSRLVREQIAENFAELKDLRQVGAVPAALPNPKVFGTKHRISSAPEWEALREYDVVVGTVQSISPEFEGVPEPPADLFDLVLVDEAHHSPAKTWRAVLDHFGSAQTILFTATPFRQDQREIKGRFIFTYDLRQAYEDGVFGDIVFQAVEPSDGESHDVAIARAAEQQLASDREAGLQHHLMVRTDSRKRATALLEVYKSNTALRLRLITGDKSLRYVKGVIAQLKAGELDGIVCVNMLGEGFNFPSLKIAAIHSPHRSLSVTLQFIGRFARVGGEGLGRATFLAVPSEVEIEAERLYDSRAVWQEMVQNLSAARVNQEAQTREVLESFEATEEIAPDLADLSLYVLEPYYHVKVYQLDAVIDLHEPVAFPEALQVVYESISEAHNAAVYITREMSLPRWTTDDRLSIIQPDLFIFYQHVESRLLFICASRRSPGLYEELVDSFNDANPRPLPLVRLNRALNDLTTLEFFNVGMRNRVAASTTESYRIITGSNADKAILKSDNRLYHRGHVFGRGIEDGDAVTIGLSSASKIWSNKSSKLPDLIDWCSTLASRIASERTPVTNSGLDYLDVGEEIEQLPEYIVGVSWPPNVFKTPHLASFETADGRVEAQLLDFELSIDGAADTPDAVALALSFGPDFVYRATFSFETNRFFEPASDHEPQLSVDLDRYSTDIIDFLNEEMPLFFTADLAFVQGYSLLRQPAEGAPVFDDRAIEVVDWAAHGVAIGVEFGPTGSDLISVHEDLERELAQSNKTVVYYDHGTGEMADFVAIEQREEGGLLVQFYHCKGATGAGPGHRVGDVYEIAGQAVKSVIWALKQRILYNIRRRFSQNIGSHRFIRGDLPTLEEMLAGATPAQIEFEFIAVQPGLQKDGLPAGMGNVLAAASDHLVRGGFRRLRVLGA